MNDCVGNKVEKGDICLMVSGIGRTDTGCDSHNITIFEVPSPESAKLGYGIHYIDGRQSKFSWINVSHSLKIDVDKVDPIFIKYFKTNMWDVWTTSDISKNNFVDIVEKSNYKNTIYKQ